MTLLDLVPLWASLSAALFALVLLYLLTRRGVMRTAVDPSGPILFQIFFTTLVLAFTGLLQVADAIGILLFLAILMAVPPRRRERLQLFAIRDWISFSIFLCVIVVLLNIVLIRQKGLLFLSDDISQARLEFFEGWGLFKRVNDVAQGLLIIAAAFLWKLQRQRTAVFLGLTACCAALTLGSRSGLISCLLAYGCYLHFQERKPSKKLLVLALVTIPCLTIGIFYLMFGQTFMGAFLYRLLAECDGPVYFFHDAMQASASVPLSYPFYILLYALRLQGQSLSDVPLGQYILQHHFQLDTDIIQGPNPQMLVESHVLFHSFGILWYVLCAACFVYLRGKAANPFTLYLAAFFVGPLLVDSRFAFSQLFTELIVLALFLIFLGGKWLLSTPTECNHGVEAAT